MSIHYDKRRKGYYVKYRILGKNTTSKRFETKAEAKKYEADLIINGDKYFKKKYKFYDVIDLYLKNQHLEDEYGTYQKSEGIFENIIKPNMPNRYINTITPVECEEFKQKINQMKHYRIINKKRVESNYKTSTKNDILQRFKAVFNYAYKNDLIDKDPCRNLLRFKRNFEEEMDARERDNHIWEPLDLKLFLTEVQSEKYKLFFTTLYYTGMRKSECLALMWKDFKDSTLNVYKSKTQKTDKGYYEIKKTKTKSSVRKIYLPPFLNQMLLEFKEKESQVEGFNEDWFIFGREDPICETTIDTHRKNAISASGVKYITNHQFRHSYASYLIGNGADIVAVSRSLGHSSIKITLDTYSHCLEKNNDEIMELLEKSSPNVLQQ